MNIYNFHSPSHAALAKLMADSVKTHHPFFANVHSYLMPIASKGDYGDESWRKVMEIGAQLLCYTLSHRRGSSIGIIDSDVIARRPFIDEAGKRLLTGGNDILFQHERDGLWNPGIMFLKVTPKVCAAFRAFTLMMPEWDGHLPHQNELMREAFKDCKVGLLPDDFAANPSNGGDKDKCALFHCNCTPPPDSVKQKLEMMQSLMLYVGYFENEH